MGKRRPATPEPSGPHGSLHFAIPTETLDLHGENAVTAERRLEFFLARIRQTRPGTVVCVITGKGKRSQREPVIKGVVARLLTGRFEEYVQEFTVDHGGGAYLIRVR